MDGLIKTSPVALTALLLLVPAAILNAANYPYPQNVSYQFGVKPAGASSASGAILTKWNTWKASHVVPAGGDLRVQRDSADGNDTVSEGISYGMLLAVYFNDKTTFDGLWRYKQSKNDGLGLMNWKISSGGGVIGANSACDADEDIAYALYLAHFQWGGSPTGGGGTYQALADAEQDKVRAYCLDSNRVKPGDAFNSCRYPSYFFPNEYRVFGLYRSAATWSAVTTNVYATIAAARNASTGLLADQVQDNGPGGGCAGISSTQYKYDSARIPFRMALDYVYYGSAQSQDQMSRQAGFFGGIAPAAVVDCYNTNGSTCGSYNAGTFFAAAACTFMYNASQQSNLNTYFNAALGDNTSPGRYFDGAIQLLSLLLLSGNMPNIADPGAIGQPITPTITPTPAPLGFAYLFEDFENAILVNGYTYSGPSPGEPPMAGVLSTTLPWAGTYSNRIQFSMPAGTYGGHGYDSSYASTGGVVSFPNANKIRFAIKTDKDVNVTVSVREGDGYGGGDNEVWQSPSSPVFAGGWQVITINTDLSLYTEDPWNPDCNPGGLSPSPCTSVDNNTFDRTSIRTVQFSFASGPTSATVYIDNIEFVPDVVPTMTATKTPFANPFNLLFDDFESINSLSAPQNVTSWAHTAGGATSSWTKDTGDKVAGNASGRLNYNLGTTGVSYGVSGTFLTPYNTGTFPAPSPPIGGTYIDATGAIRLAMWIKADMGLKYRLTFQEAGTSSQPIGASDGEAWYTSLLTGTGAWQWVEVDLGDFTEDPYNSLCNPNGDPLPGPCLVGFGAGNNTINVNALWQVGIRLPGEQVGVASRTGTVNFDDVTFVTTWRTPTAGPSFTRTATSTRTPTQANTATRSFTPTATRTTTRTATRTVTRTHTPTSTPAITSTYTRTYTRTITPTITPTVTHTATRTITLTRTATITPTATRTITTTHTSTMTLTHTPVPMGSTATLTFSHSPTFTVTPTFTRTVTLTSTPVDTASPTAVDTANTTPIDSPTHTPSDTATLTATENFTPALSSTSTLTHTPVDTPTVTLTPTDVPVGSSPSPTPTHSPVFTFSSTQTPTSTRTSTPQDTKTVTTTITVTATFSASPTPPACPIVFGQTAHSITPNGIADYVVASDFNLASPGSVNRLSAWVEDDTAGGQMRMALYDDAGGIPGNLLAEGPVTVTNSPAWMSAPIAPVALPAGTYWLAYVTERSLDISADVQAGSSIRGNPLPFGPMPATMPALATYFVDQQLALLAEFCPLPTATATFSMTPTFTATRTSTPTSNPTFTFTITTTHTATITPTITLTTTSTLVSTASYTYTATPTYTPPPPSITSVSESQGLDEGGNMITVTGANFTANTIILVGGLPLENAVLINSSTIQGQLPAHSMGWADIQAVDSSTGSSAAMNNAYLFVPPPEGENRILEHAAAPNPISDPYLASAAIHVLLAGSADSVRVRIYTKAMVVVHDWQDSSTFRGAGWHSVRFPPEFFGNAVNGFYYYVLNPVRNGEQGGQVTGKIMLLR